MKKIWLIAAAVTVTLQLKDQTHAAAEGTLNINADGSLSFQVQKLLVDDTSGDKLSLGTPQVIKLTDEQQAKLQPVLTEVLDAAFNHTENAPVVAALVATAEANGVKGTADAGDIAATQNPAVVAAAENVSALPLEGADKGDNENLVADPNAPKTEAPASESNQEENPE